MGSRESGDKIPKKICSETVPGLVFYGRVSGHSTAPVLLAARAPQT
jgi:hypothetical protein